MCIAVYLALIGLFLFYSDYVVEQYALAIPSADQGAMVVAVGWELVPLLWPVVVVAVLIGSAVSAWVTRRCRVCASPRSRQDRD
jgi:membrane protein implicated in regulation of membrane protease activity